MHEIIYDFREAIIGLLETVCTFASNLCRRSGWDRRKRLENKRRTPLSLPDRRGSMYETTRQMSVYGG